MPWKETHVEEERMRFISAYLDGECEWTMSELCEAFGVSRKTGYKWLDRYRSLGLEGLRDRSRAPRAHPNAVAAEVVEQLLRMRQRHRWWGPRKIVARLRAEQPTISWPAASTAGGILKRHGLVKARRRRRRGEEGQATGLCEPLRPNDQWSADFKGWFRTGDGRRCDPLTISDGFSRFLLCCRVVERPDEEHARAVFRQAFGEYGLPLVLRTDNGPPFASSTALGGLTRLSVWWVKLGIGLERIAAGQPQQNGRHERLRAKRDTHSHSHQNPF